MNEELHRQWRERLDRHGGSGLTVREFCEREGVSAASFHAWRRKLASASRSSIGQGNGRKARAAREKRQPTPTARERSSRQSGGAAFQPTGDADAEIQFVQLPLPVAPSGAWVELTLHDGTVVRVPAQNLAAVELVLATLLGRGGNFSGGEAHRA